MDKEKFNKLYYVVPVYVLNSINPEKFTELGLCHFLSQCSHESSKFSRTTENLNYSANALMSVFKKYFPDIEKANRYARQPEMIGSLVYANRMGNGDEASREGYNFRGRGYIQMTGKDNYKAFTDYIKENCISNPDLVASKYPLESAMFFFDKNSLWYICEEGSSDETITKLTKRINGGTNGLAERITKFNQLWKLIQ